MYKTTKLYYINPLLSSCTATILDISPKGIVESQRKTRHGVKRI